MNTRPGRPTIHLSPNSPFDDDVAEMIGDGAIAMAEHIASAPVEVQGSIVATLVLTWLMNTRADPGADWAALSDAIEAGVTKAVAIGRVGGSA